jgi:GTPase SAR1 family protein
LWADQFSPSEPSQLAIHPKKLSTVHAWLIDALHGAPHTRKYRRVLILAGPAGCGKSTIIHSLAHQKHHQVPPTGSSAPSTSSHIPSVKSTSKTSPTPPIEGIGYEILEWKNTGNESSTYIYTTSPSLEKKKNTNTKKEQTKNTMKNKFKK